MASAVQFFGGGNVIAAFKNRGIDTWAILQGKDLITSGEGAEELETFLGMLENGGGSAVYKLCVYNNAEADNITNKTECNGSFNFKLDAAAGQIGRAAAPGFPAAHAGAGDPIYSRVHAYISGKVNESLDKLMKGEKEEEEKPAGVMGFIDGLVSDPEKLQNVVAIIAGVKQLLFPGALSVPGPAALGTVGPQRAASPTLPPVSDQEAEAERLAVILDRLEKQDPGIIDHLAKLADLAETKNGLFKMLLTQLDAL